MKTRKVKDLKKNDANPRSIVDSKKKMLAKSMDELGDISGVLYNHKTKRLFGGHQRQDGFDAEAKIVVTKKFAKPTKKGTVELGYILHKGEQFSYRGVYWSEEKERAASINANKGAGSWIEDMLEDQLAELHANADFDFDLSMFDETDLKDFKFNFGDDESDEEAEEKEIDENIETENECPSCHYKW